VEKQMDDNDNTYYHVFNRGVEKRTIFQDAQDYGVFLSYLKECLTLKDEKELTKLFLKAKTSKEKAIIIRSQRLKNFHQEIDLLAYSLMPNHFHFFIRQNVKQSLERFMRAFCTRYVMYFNAKYERVGPLFQGRYKSVLIDDEGQYLHISRYIHMQALNLQGQSVQQIQPSSYPEYIGERNTDWIHSDVILESFSKTDQKFTYAAFVLELLQGRTLQREA
jgi:putative transposase